MKKTLFIPIFILKFGISFAQNKIIGFITEQNSGKKPVANAIINSSGANQNVSTDKGQFILTFQGLEVGENVVLRPEKTGWELVNEKEMKTLIPAKPNENPVKIVLCKAGTLAIAKQAYYKVADPYIIQQYNKKLAALDKEKANYQAEKAKLQEERNRLQNQLEEYAEEFIRVNLDDASEIERQAIALFKEGKIDESIKLRESLKSGVEIRNAVQRKAKEDSIIALHTRNLKALAKDYIFKFDFKAAEQKFEELVLADTTNFDNTFDFAYFLAQQNQHEKAIRYYQSVLKLTRTESYIAVTLNNLGNLHIDKNEYSAAIKAYSNALEIYERLAKTNPVTDEPNLAMALNNLGNLYTDKNEYTLAFKNYSNALEIRERLAKTNPATYEPDVARTLNNFGIFYQAKKDYVSAVSTYTKALEISERLAQNNPATYEPNVAGTQKNLGILYQAKKDYPSAFSAYSKALKIYERLAKTNSEVYDIELCGNIVLLGLLQKAYYQTAQQDRIDGYLEKANQILSNYKDVPLAKIILDDVVDLKEHFNIRELLLPIQTLQNQLEKVEKYAEKIEIQKRIIENYQILVVHGYPNFANELGSSFSSLAWYQLFEKQFAEAEKSANEAFNPTTFKKTEDYDAKIEWANTNLALALLFQGKYAVSEKIYLALKDKPYNNATYRETFLADLDELEKAGITNPDVLKIRELLKNQSENKIDYFQKIKLQNSNIEKYLELIKNGNRSYEHNLKSSLGTLSFYQILTKNFKGAEKSANEALNPTQFKKSENYDAENKWVKVNLGLSKFLQGKMTYDELQKIYLDLKDSYAQPLLSGLDTLEKEGVWHPDFTKIREFLKK